MRTIKIALVILGLTQALNLATLYFQQVAIDQSIENIYFLTVLAVKQEDEIEKIKASLGAAIEENDRMIKQLDLISAASRTSWAQAYKLMREIQ